MLAPRAFLKNPIRLICSALLLIVSSRALAQTNPPTVVRDPNAMALVSKSLQALAGGTTLTDITLQANATYTAGSDVEMGPATLVALGNRQSSVTLNLTNGQRKELRSGFAGAWVGSDGVAHAIGSPNCLIDASWFYPALTLAALASDPTISITLAGEENLNGEAVYDLVLNRVIPRNNVSAMAMIIAQSTMHLYLDAGTLLPAALAFNLHPEIDGGINIPCQIRFGAYQSFGGVQVPNRIQRYFQNSLTLDLTVANAVVNSGVPVSYFILPAVTAGGAQ